VAGPPTATSGERGPARGVSRAFITGALAIVVFLGLAWRFRDHQVDDAFISFRYARNLAAGLGPVFNAGERVEGYSNFLWVVLLAAGLRIGVAAEVLSKLLGLAAACGTIAVVARASSRLKLSGATAWLAPVLLAVSPALAVWSTAGLETTLFALLLTYGVCRLAEDVEEGGPSVATAAVFGLTSWTRPEGALFGGAMSALLLLQSGASRPGRVAWARWTGVFLLVFLSYFIWRWRYYGFLLPNTFYAKVDVGGSQVGRGLRYLSAFGAAAGYWLFLPPLALVRIRRKGLTVLACATVAGLLFTVFVGGDGLPMHRFLVPSLGTFFLLVAWGCDTLLGQFAATRTKRAIAVTVLALACLYSSRGAFAGAEYKYVEQDVAETAAWREIGLWFRENAEPDAWIGVVPAGAVPYYSGLRTIDMLGLNDVTIAHTPIPMGHRQAGHEKYNTAYVLGRAPTYLLIGTYRLLDAPETPWQQITPYYTVERELLASPEFRDHYSIRQGKTPSGYFAFFARN
jgi:arabinofuranosyltransferase